MESITFLYSRGTPQVRTVCRVELHTKQGQPGVRIVLDTPGGDDPYAVAAFTSPEIDKLISALTQAQKHLQQRVQVQGEIGETIANKPTSEDQIKRTIIEGVDVADPQGSPFRIKDQEIQDAIGSQDLDAWMESFCHDQGFSSASANGVTVFGKGSTTLGF